MCFATVYYIQKTNDSTQLQYIETKKSMKNLTILSQFVTFIFIFKLFTFQCKKYIFSIFIK